jgi:hypothetical protein
MYCNAVTRKGRKGEHILQAAIGGGRTLNDAGTAVVCPNCNSGCLSIIDRELCSHSYLSVVASQELNAKLWNAWDVDHAESHLLIEACPEWGADKMLAGLRAYPQVILERSGPSVRGDYSEFQEFGREQASKLLLRAVRHCFDRWRHTGKGLHFRKVDSGIINDGYRLAPRVFAPHSIFETVRDLRNRDFVLKFLNEEDKRFALWSLSKLENSPDFKNWSSKSGSHSPRLCFFFDINRTLRALMKIGLNLIAAYCPNTLVNRRSFSHAMQIIMGEIQIPFPVIGENGFVNADDIQEIRGTPTEHTFRLLYLNNLWHVFFCFFGGRIGAHVRIPGPNQEDWICANIVAPIGYKEWTIKTSSIIQSMPKQRVDWSNSEKITPTLKLRYSTSDVRVQFRRVNRNKENNYI